MLGRKGSCGEPLPGSLLKLVFVEILVLYEDRKVLKSRIARMLGICNFYCLPLVLFCLNFRVGDRCCNLTWDPLVDFVN